MPPFVAPLLLAPLLLALLLLALPSPASAATTLAVTNFDTNTSDERLLPLGRGLAAMLITDLTSVQALTVVERGRISEVLGELELQKSPFIDPKTAVAVGKGLGAEWVLTGAVAALNDTLRIDARLVEVGTGRLLEASSVTGKVDEFFLLEKELATAILDKLQVRASAREGAQMGRVATESFDAFLAWSEGLAAFDRGAMEDARRKLEEALALDDRFGLATSLLDALRSRLRELDGRRAEATSGQAKVVLTRLTDLKKSGGPYDALQMELIPLSAIMSSPGNARAAAGIGAAIMDLALPETLRLGGPQGVYSINEWAMFSYTMAQQWLGRRSDYLAYGNAFLERYPASIMGPAFASGLEGLLTLMREEEAGRKQIPAVRAEASGYAFKTRCQGERNPSARLAACAEWSKLSKAAGKPLADEELEMWARAADEAGDVAVIERLLAEARAKDAYAQSAEDIGRILENCQREQADADEAPQKIAEAKRASDVVRAARALKTAARRSAAHEALEGALKRWPDDNEVYEESIELAMHFGDREGAENAVKRWEEAAARNPEVKVSASTVRRVRSWDEDTRWVTDADAMALLQLAVGFIKIGQRREAAQAYLDLAERHPGFESMGADSSLSSAASLFYQAWAMEEARATYLKLLERFPDSPSSRGATSMLSLIPE